MTRLFLAVAAAIAVLTIGAPVAAHAQTCAYWTADPMPWPIPNGACAPIEVRCARPLSHTCDRVIRKVAGQ